MGKENVIARHEPFPPRRWTYAQLRGGNLLILLSLVGCVMSSKAVKEVSEPKITPVKVPIVVEEIVRPASQMPSVTSEDIAIGISYWQITNLISEFIEIEAVEDKKFIGTSENNLIALEITGDKENITKAKISLTYPDKIESHEADLNNAIMLRFLRNIAPESGDWPARIKSILDKFSLVEPNTVDEEDLALNGRSLNILYDKKIDSITLTLKHK